MGMADDLRREQQHRNNAEDRKKAENAILFDAIDQALRELMPEFTSTLRELGVKPYKHAFGTDTLGSAFLRRSQTGYQISIGGAHLPSVRIGTSRSGSWSYLDKSNTKISSRQARVNFSKVAFPVRDISMVKSWVHEQLKAEARRLAKI